MTWEIVVGIITLIGVLGTVAAWASKLSRSLSSLETTLKALDETLHELKVSMNMIAGLQSLKDVTGAKTTPRCSEFYVHDVKLCAPPFGTQTEKMRFPKKFGKLF